MTAYKEFSELDVSTFAEKNRLSDSGSRTVMIACDPMHDYRLEVPGYCDGSPLRSYVETHNSTLVASAPSEMAEGDFDVLIINLPHDVGDSITPTATPIELQGNDGHIHWDHSIEAGKQFTYGDVLVATFATGIIPYSAAFFTALAAGEATIQAMNFNKYRGAMAARCLGAAIEVHNTTAKIYQQGSVVCARWPIIEELNFYEYLDQAAEDPYTHCLKPAFPFHKTPSYISGAMEFPGAVKWEASKGCYVVVNMADPLNHPFRVVKNCESCGTPKSGQLTGTVESFGTLPRDSAFLKLLNSLRQNDMQQTLTWFSGLSYSTTLDIQTRGYYEYVPYYNDVNFEVTKAPVEIDLKALKMLAAIQQRMPIAVFANMNAKGDYYRMILSAADHILRTGIDAAMSSGDPRFVSAGLAARAIRNAVVRSQNKSSTNKKAPSKKQIDNQRMITSKRTLRQVRR